MTSATVGTTMTSTEKLQVIVSVTVDVLVTINRSVEEKTETLCGRQSWTVHVTKRAHSS